jgi:NitT/TauT family transport system ATP-binding protein
MAPPPVLALDGVSRRYPGGLLALQGLSFEVAEGEFVSIVGPSGCGKSTLLSMLAGLSLPETGRVVSSVREPGELGVVFQDPTLMPWASVVDNIAMPLRLLRRPSGEVARQVDEALASVGLQGFARSLPAELSGGMRMRVSIARALVTRPRLLLMDEPFAALDEMTRETMNEQLLALWRSLGLTCVFVTHSLYEAVFLSTRVLVMSPRPGRIVDEVAIDAAIPRNEHWRATADFASLRADLSACLRRGEALGL